ncbi:hypothetical protein [Thermogemmatispora sp.]|uniref:hypothetical protein n=1 Tax=Thermogemmatispora sp. TaxID=1968838 RepID=UPI0035E43A0F
MEPADLPMHPASLLAHLCRQQPLAAGAGAPLLRQISMPAPVREQTSLDGAALLISVDNGNDALKGALLHARAPRLITRRIATAYAPADLVRVGEEVPTWQVDASEPFWIGEQALREASTVESLPVGLSPDRLPDPRWQRFFFACLVELLQAAGYERPGRAWQGEYALLLSLGLPNEELSRNSLHPAVLQALRPLLEVPRLVQRTDEGGQTSTWRLRLVDVTPYPQTFGSFAAWYYSPTGEALPTHVVKHLTFDIGGGQLHRCTVTIDGPAEGQGGRPRLRMQATLLDEGTIALARAARDRLRSHYPGLRLSDTEAQQVLISGTLLRGGRRVDVTELLNEVITARSQRLLTHLRHLLQEEQTFVMCTGGGTILLERALRSLLGQRRAQESMLIVPRELASVLNALGGYLLAQAAAQKRQTAARTGEEVSSR